MPPMYEVYEWGEHFEISQSSRVKGALKWVAIPTKHDGLTFRRVIGRKDAGEVYTAWMLILQVAAKCPVRGLLCAGGCSEHKHTPLRECSECARSALRASDLALKTGFSEKAFSLALEVLSSEEVGWLLRVDSEHAPSTLGEQSTSRARAVRDETGHDVTRHDETGESVPKKKRAETDDAEWLAGLQESDAYRTLNVKACHDAMLMWCAVNNKQPTRRRFINWLNREDKPMLVTRQNGSQQQPQLNLSPKMQRNFEVLNAWSPPVKRDESK